MNLCICVLLLSVWTTNCLNISTGVKTPDNIKEENVEDFRKRVLKVINGVMTCAFLLICFCLIHHNCMIEPVKKNPVIKKDAEAKSSWSTMLTCRESKTKDLCIPEKQALLSNADDLSRPTTPEIPPVQPKAGKLVRKSSSKTSFKSPSLLELFRTSYMEESRRTHPKKTRKLAAKATSSPAAKRVKVSSLASLQSLGKPAVSPDPENQILPPKPPSKMELTKPPEYHPKMSGSVGKVDVAFEPLPATTSKHDAEKGLVCKPSDSFVTISEENDGYLSDSNEMMSLARSFHEVDYQNYEYFAIASDNDMDDDSDDSDKEITIICNITSNDLLPKGFPE